ncbi:metallophosphoesterase [Paraburkholderia sp. EG287A]|uniref:metallophosphoesterase family protein n=1 Tax=unclassified Paraburkholderia TaxID=2615204 RepID=UPI0034D33423
MPKKRSVRTSASNGSGSSRVLAAPVFSQPQPTPDPQTFIVRHASDVAAYRMIDELNREHKLKALPFPAPRGGVEPRLTLADVIDNDPAILNQINTNRQIVFHSTGDCGSTRGPKTQNEVSDKMVSDFDETDPAEVPQFNFLLGDIVYSFGEAQYYYDQFYEPYRDYHAPILAVAGNHDGMISPLQHEKSLQAFLRNFCSDCFQVSPDAGNLSRTAQIQPGVFFTFEAPFVRIIALYSNTLEDPGVISNSDIGKSQLKFLKAALTRVKKEGYTGALLFAHHHPPYVARGRHGWSVEMQQQIDAICAEVGVWPHADLAGHAHNYQRFTRTRPDGTHIPYIVCGNGGHNVQRLTTNGQPPLRAPQLIQAATNSTDAVVIENYDDQNYGYLRIVADDTQLRIEYHAAVDGPYTKAPDDQVTVDLATRQLSHYVARNAGIPALATRIREFAQSGKARR